MQPSRLTAASPRLPRSVPEHHVTLMYLLRPGRAPVYLLCTASSCTGLLLWAPADSRQVAPHSPPPVAASSLSFLFFSFCLGMRLPYPLYLPPACVPGAGSCASLSFPSGPFSPTPKTQNHPFRQDAPLLWCCRHRAGPGGRPRGRAREGAGSAPGGG